MFPAVLGANLCYLSFDLRISDYDEMPRLTIASRWSPLSGFKNARKSLFWYIDVQEFSNASPLFDDVFELQSQSSLSTTARVEYVPVRARTYYFLVLVG